ncbi:substrate-binding domain-containing protein [Stappia sp. GBMRC 2046]|uniref:Substrate-binding domain-containing protein n=1 Tax=Stappia sediminis TaxID=2692190 RepID=A0A7X3LRX7_9HYPH|nr:sugar-binding protein [Stappia sediminis]MXN63995.1 substrate-binding domain-containing protein [Stappia sediminis]
MKKLMYAAIMAAVALPPAGALAADYNFALVPKAMNNPFFDLARDGCYKAQEELEGVTCNYIGPGEHTELEQIQIVQDLISQGVDGIAVSPSNAPAMGKALKAAVEAGIPVMTWDADLLEEDKGIRATFVGTKNYDIGVNLAKIAMARHPDGGKVCLQTGGAAAANHNERLKGIRDTLSGKDTGTPPGEPLSGENGWTEVAGCPLITDDDGNKAIQGMTDILAKEADLTAFISTGAFTQWFDNAYRQAAEPYKDKMESGELSIIVADTLPMQMAQLKDGLSNGQVGQRPFEMGYRAMFVLKDLAEGKSVEDPIYTGLDVCTPDNADSCLAQ